MSAKSFKLNGRHVLAVLVGFFMTVIAANAIFITLAIKSFPGEQEKKSYLQGLAYNERIAEREAQAALGWSARLARSEIVGDEGVIELEFASANGAPVEGLALTGLLARPASRNSDAPLVFEEVEPGRYRATAPEISPGAWRLSAAATSARGEKFRLEKRLLLQ